ncbi:MAG: hypothetical protein NTW60_01915, partial [Candidatus Wolfebacteria bacterium]|nr:hypothetical protein [Candidatus Wolfebacteria bacterium]
MMTCCEKLARILRTDKDNIRLLEEKMAVVSGRKGIIEKISEENDFVIKNRLDILGLKTTADAKEIYNGLLRKIETDDVNLYKVLGEPRATVPADWERVLKAAKDSVRPPKGFFLKKEKALEFLRKEPPLKVIRSLGYSNADELIANENFFEIWTSLRFLEGSEWLNGVFFKYYETLSPDDFEEREITTIALSERWAKAAQEFIKKKHHNISHLKELGVIYVLPLSLEISGETLRNFSLILHYFSEIAFYSDLFRHYAKDGETFAKNIISLLRGDVLDARLAPGNKAEWLIIQRYLAKEDPYDWRLFEPHVNPEALHWERAERMLLVAARQLDHSLADLNFWQDLNWVGDYFKTDAGPDMLVSFNLIDASMSLAKEKEMTKYLYHHQESLWNKIFIEYSSEEKMEELI